MLLSCAPTTMKHEALPLRRRNSVPNICESQTFPSQPSGLTHTDVPYAQDTLHLQNVGTIRTTSEANLWKMAPNAAGYESSAKTHSQISYVSANRSLNKIEFGFIKVDQKSREILSKAIFALNQHMEKDAMSFPSHFTENDVHYTPYFAFHESHFPEDFAQGTDIGDFTKYHPMGLTHVQGQRATHYHYTLNWKPSVQHDLEHPNLTVPSSELHLQTPQRYLPLLVRHLAEPDQKLIDHAENFSESLGLKGAAPIKADLKDFAECVQALPAASSPTHWYDTLAEQGAKVDEHYPLSINLERTPEEVLTHARALAMSEEPIETQLHPDKSNEITIPKRRPQLAEYFDVLHAVKFGHPILQNVGANDEIQHALKTAITSFSTNVVA